MGPETGKAEMVCSSSTNGIITSGGGFSTIVSRPSWQNNTINSYFSIIKDSVDAPTFGYNLEGRAYPDISFIGVNYQVLIDGATYSVYGTSASTPVFAAFVTLINSARLAKKLPSIGFINPTLYSAGHNFTRGLGEAEFTDVISGNNKCCNSEIGGTCCATGFNAVSGW